MKRRRRKKRKGINKIIKIIIGIVLVLFLVFAGLVIYYVAVGLEQEDILKQEVINFSNKDLANDDYSIYVKTKGDYAYIEEAAKKFYKELSDNVKIVNYYIADEELINLLAADNLNKERPNYTKSYAIIERDKSKVLDALKNISKLCEKKTVENLIDKDKIDSSSYEIFEELMLTKKDIEDLTETKNKMEFISKNLNLFFDKEVEILDFLKANDSNWQYIDNQLGFATDELVNKYNTLCNDLKEIAKKLETEVISNNRSNDVKITA